MTKLNNTPIPDRVYNLRFIQRYSLTPRITSESVAEHSFYVAVFVMELHKTYDFDLGKALFMSLIHDFAESELGDVTLTAKMSHPIIGQAVDVAENEIMKSFGDGVYQAYKEYSKRESVEAKIVKFADVLQVKQYLENENSIGHSSKMEKMMEDTIKIIDEYKRNLSIYLR